MDESGVKFAATRPLFEAIQLHYHKSVGILWAGMARMVLEGAGY